MFAAMKARKARRAALRQMELSRLRRLMEENQRALDEIERRRNAPCSGCIAAGWIDEKGRPIAQLS